jgi:hypothetical protein
VSSFSSMLGLQLGDRLVFSTEPTSVCNDMYLLLLSTASKHAVLGLARATAPVVRKEGILIKYVYICCLPYYYCLSPLTFNFEPSFRCHCSVVGPVSLFNPLPPSSDSRRSTLMLASLFSSLIYFYSHCYDRLTHERV